MLNNKILEMNSIYTVRNQYDSKYKRNTYRAYVPTLLCWTGDSYFEKLSPVLPFDLKISSFKENMSKFSISCKNSNMYRKLLRLLVF